MRKRRQLILSLTVALIAGVIILLPAPVTTTEKYPVQINNEVQQLPQMAQMPLQLQQELAPVAVEQPVMGRVFCGSPKQQNWKNINTGNAEIGKRLASDKGWTGDQWTALQELWACESSWNHLIGNTEGSGAYGIPQSLPASKMAKFGEDYLTNPETQIKWGVEYIASRYKNPRAALNFHYANNWY